MEDLYYMLCQVLFRVSGFVKEVIIDVQENGNKLV